VRWPLLITTVLAVWIVADVVVGREPGLAEGLACLGCLLALAWASYDLRSQGFVAAFCRGSRASSDVALTFDDGPDPTTTPQVLETLAARGVVATFFLVGAKAEQHPELARRIAEAGHEVGNHGYEHRWQAMLTPARAERLIEQGRDAIRRACGVEPRSFRPPYGVTTPALGLAVRRLGVQVAGWSVRTMDTTKRANQADRLARETLARVAPGDVLLLHDAPERPGGPAPAGPAMLETLLAGLAKRGLQAVTLSQLQARDG
jgi:peptidoglycan/xylan/chitin deacetylase (PgdA/CDA1 family)